jgi:hypothetical protein
MFAPPFFGLQRRHHLNHVHLTAQMFRLMEGAISFPGHIA